MRILFFLYLLPVNFALSSVCSNRGSNSSDVSLDLTAKCNYFYTSNIDIDEATATEMTFSDFFLLVTVPLSDKSDCCDICFQHDSCFLFRFHNSTKTCDLFAAKNLSKFGFQIFKNDCYDLGFVTGK